MMNRRIRALGALAAIAVVIVALHLASRFGLRGPTGLSRAELSDWFDDPVALIATIVRWIALALAYYLFVAVAVLALTEPDPDNAATGIRRLVPPGMASVVGVALGLTATAGPAVIHMASTGPATSLNPPQSLTLSTLDDPLVLDEQSEAETINPADHTGTIHTSAPAPELWEVRTGDSMWLIARETLADDLPAGENITDQTVAAYVDVLVEANLDRLVEPGNPDLILPGQELVLPSISRGPFGDL